MRPAKRYWIYSGLGVPEGAGLVRRPNRRSAADRIILLGHTSLQGLVAPLSSLLADRGSILHVDLRDATLRDWAKHDWLTGHLAAFRPTAVFLALDPRDSMAKQSVRNRVRKAGAVDVWLVPPGISWAATRRYVPAPDLNARGYAAWASRALAVVK